MKKPPRPSFEDQRLHDIHYSVRGGLRKLVPTNGFGWPAYNRYWVANSRHSPHYERDASEFLIVSLQLWEDSRKKPAVWQCYLTIKDGDDMSLQRWREFTYENWCEQLDLYNSITQFDDHTRDYLRLEGVD